MEFIQLTTWLASKSLLSEPYTAVATLHQSASMALLYNIAHIAGTVYIYTALNRRYSDLVPLTDLHD
jgi:hypothetical protein